MGYVMEDQVPIWELQWEADGGRSRTALLVR
jgi:hypothetical protein